jgi:nucleotide-binding universal stress UspA family protein
VLQLKASEVGRELTTRPTRMIKLKPGPMPSEIAFKRILVAVDGSDSSTRAGRLAARLAKRNEADLLVVSVIQSVTRPFMPTPIERPSIPTLQNYYVYASRNAEQWVDEVASSARNLGVNVRTRVLKGATSIVKAITDYASSQQVDLIVVGRKGAGGFKRLLVGSVSNGVVNHARCSVLVVR